MVKLLEAINKKGRIKKKKNAQTFCEMVEVHIDGQLLLLPALSPSLSIASSPSLVPVLFLFP
jgi:hypothetical protein